MKAVCIAEFGVVNAERSDITPMFETTAFKSPGPDHLADDLFHLLHVVLGHFQASPGGSLEVDHELAGIGTRKK